MLYSLLGARAPDGFALTAQAYCEALAETGIEGELRRISDLDHHGVVLLRFGTALCPRTDVDQLKRQLSP